MCAAAAGQVGANSELERGGPATCETNPTFSPVVYRKERRFGGYCCKAQRVFTILGISHREVTEDGIILFCVFLGLFCFFLCVPQSNSERAFLASLTESTTGSHHASREAQKWHHPVMGDACLQQADRKNKKIKSLREICCSLQDNPEQV